MDPSIRYLKILEMIPRDPDGITVRELIIKLREFETESQPLRDQDRKAEIRTIQRALLNLSLQYPIGNRREGRENLWFWLSSAPSIILPTLDLNTALTLSLARQYLDSILPPSALKAMSAILRQSEVRLSTTHHKHHSQSGAFWWRDKVALAPSGILRSFPSASPKIEAIIYEALLNEAAILVSYKPWNSKSQHKYVVSPIGLVVRNQLVYVISVDHADGKVRNRLLHRFLSAEISDEPFRKLEGFKAQEYVNEGSFNFMLEPKAPKISLRIQIDDKPLTGIRECPISKDQVINQLKEDLFELRATVDNTFELRQWIMSHGHHIQVMEPLDLRKEFSDSAKILAAMYLD